MSFLKATASQDGHAGYSDPLVEQPFLVSTINMINTLAVLEEDGDHHHV